MRLRTSSRVPVSTGWAADLAAAIDCELLRPLSASTGRQVWLARLATAGHRPFEDEFAVVEMSTPEWVGDSVLPAKDVRAEAALAEGERVFPRIVDTIRMGGDCSARIVEYRPAHNFVGRRAVPCSSAVAARVLLDLLGAAQRLAASGLCLGHVRLEDAGHDEGGSLVIYRARHLHRRHQPEEETARGIQASENCCRRGLSSALVLDVLADIFPRSQRTSELRTEIEEILQSSRDEHRMFEALTLAITDRIAPAPERGAGSGGYLSGAGTTRQRRTSWMPAEEMGSRRAHGAGNRRHTPERNGTPPQNTVHRRTTRRTHSPSRVRHVFHQQKMSDSPTVPRARKVAVGLVAAVVLTGVIWMAVPDLTATSTHASHSSPSESAVSRETAGELGVSGETAVTAPSRPPGESTPDVSSEDGASLDSEESGAPFEATAHEAAVRLLRDVADCPSDDRDADCWTQAFGEGPPNALDRMEELRGQGVLRDVPEVSVVDEMGGVVLVAVTWPETGPERSAETGARQETTTASLLITRSEAGWRIRGIY